TIVFMFKRSKVNVYGIEIGIKLKEKHKPDKTVDASLWRTSKLEYLQLLTLITGEYSKKKKWNETKPISLEKKLSQIIAYLEITANDELHWKTERDKREKERKEQEKIERRKAEIQGLEVKKLKDLIALSRQWHEVQKF